MLAKFTSAVVITAILSLLLPSIARAQTGEVAGTIVDAETGVPLIGANVLLMGTSIGATNRAASQIPYPAVGRCPDPMSAA